MTTDRTDHPPIEGGYTGIKRSSIELLPAAKAVVDEYWKCWAFNGQLPNRETTCISIPSNLLYILYQAIYGTVPSK